MSGSPLQCNAISSLCKCLKNSLGHVSFTSDIWSQQNLKSYMAVTAHYAAKSPSGHLVLKSQLIAFRHLHGSHTGINIGKVFVQIIKEIGCLHKILMITLDNTSNNYTFMEQIAVELHWLNIPFDEEGNFIWCFPHIVNIAVKSGLKYLTTLPLFNPDLDFNTDQDTKELSDTFCSDIEYYDALKSDVVSAARWLVTACRASGQHREDLEDTIEEGNNKGGWGELPELL